MPASLPPPRGRATSAYDAHAVGARTRRAGGTHSGGASMVRTVRTLALAVTLALTALAVAQPLVVMQSADAATLDPTMNRETPTFNVLINVFDALLTKRADGDYGPGLAASWEVSDDGTVWDMRLRDDVTFHDGTPFTAEAVVFTVQRIL